MVHPLRRPIFTDAQDRPDDAGRALLADLQGNIVAHHGASRSVQLLISFGHPSSANEAQQIRARAKAWIASVRARDLLTSALTLSDRRGDPNQKVFRMLLLSAAGYVLLGASRPAEGAFRDGMQARARRLNDPQLAQWEPAYQLDPNDLHAFVLIAHDDPAVLATEQQQLTAEIEAIGGSILVAEHGAALKDNHGEDIEHFGYRDGVSQPKFFATPSTWDAEKDKPFKKPVALRHVLVEDRHAPGTYGSYFVYRKLEQDVAGWNKAVVRVAAELNLNPELVGAMAVGRFKDGTPVTTHPTPKGPDADTNDFTFDADTSGTRCPFHAHIRKTNPRGSLGVLVNLFLPEEARRIARRGIPYGTPGQADGEVGLLFMCFQADITDQFEFMQASWSNDPTFPPLRRSGVDPVIGQVDGAHRERHWPSWPSDWNAPHGDRQEVAFGEHVRLRGGEYFYAPSLAALDVLSRP